MLNKLDKVNEIKREFKVFIDKICKEEDIDLGGNIAILGATIDLLLAAGQGNDEVDEKFVRMQVTEYLKKWFDEYERCPQRTYRIFRKLKK